MVHAQSIEMLRRRADAKARTRAFFAARDVLEVDTPILGRGLVVEEAIEPIRCRDGQDGRARYLLASPEGPMKRLLAAGSGPIYQFAHAFREGEVGRRHRTEFTLLEWYRPGYDDRALMDEVEELVRTVVPSVPRGPFDRRSYREIFLDAAGVDPFGTTVAELRGTCDRLGVPVPENFESGSIDDALDLLLVGGVEPGLGCSTPLFVHDYPASQAALAQVHEDSAGRPVARRFELYIDGVELANGYHELGDACEQRQRFEDANRARLEHGLEAIPLDEALLAALASGDFPDCAGVALGLDRLLMVATGSDDIGQVRPLPFSDG